MEVTGGKRRRLGRLIDKSALIVWVVDRGGKSKHRFAPTKVRAGTLKPVADTAERRYIDNSLREQGEKPQDGEQKLERTGTDAPARVPRPQLTRAGVRKSARMEQDPESRDGVPVCGWSRAAAKRGSPLIPRRASEHRTPNSRAFAARWRLATDKVLATTQHPGGRGVAPIWVPHRDTSEPRHTTGPAEALRRPVISSFGSAHLGAVRPAPRRRAAPLARCRWVAEAETERQNSERCRGPAKLQSPALPEEIRPFSRRFWVGGRGNSRDHPPCGRMVPSTGLVRETRTNLSTFYRLSGDVYHAGVRERFSRRHFGVAKSASLRSGWSMVSGPLKKVERLVRVSRTNPVDGTIRPQGGWSLELPLVGGAGARQPPEKQEIARRKIAPLSRRHREQNRPSGVLFPISGGVVGSVSG